VQLAIQPKNAGTGGQERWEIHEEKEYDRVLLDAEAQLAGEEACREADA
jgi:hypothetical protein